MADWMDPELRSLEVELHLGGTVRSEALRQKAGLELPLQQKSHISGGAEAF